MPYVNVKLAGKITDDEKKKIVQGVAQLLEDVLNKPKSATYTVIDEIDPNNWGHGDKTLAEIRAKTS